METEVHATITTKKKKESKKRGTGIEIVDKESTQEHLKKSNQTTTTKITCLEESDRKNGLAFLFFYHVHIFIGERFIDFCNISETMKKNIPIIQYITTFSDSSPLSLTK